MKIFYLLALFILASASAWPQTIIRPNNVPSGIFFQGTSYTAYSKNDKIWEFHADHIEGTPKRAKASRVHGTIFRKGKPRYTLTASVAFINPETTDIYFPNGATFLSNRGEEIGVRILLWKARDKKFLGSKGVTVHHLNTNVKGDRMVLSQDAEDIHLYGHVKGRIVP